MKKKSTTSRMVKQAFKKTMERLHKKEDISLYALYFNGYRTGFNAGKRDKK